jgi:hypothetical protein
MALRRSNFQILDIYGCASLQFEANERTEAKKMAASTDNGPHVTDNCSDHRNLKFIRKSKEIRKSKIYKIYAFMHAGRSNCRFLLQAGSNTATVTT